MHGASISRWTMAYFAASIAFLLAGTATMASGYGLVTTSVGAPAALAVVHMIAVGWLGLLFCGALLQFVPVLAATQLRLPWLAGPALLFLVLGTLLLVAGFVALGGDIDIDPRIISFGGGLLGLGVVLVAIALAATVLVQKAFGVSGILVLTGLFSLLVTVASGNIFAALLSGVMTGETLAARLPDLIPFHAASGVLGWMTVTAIGVSYRLFTMFMLAPENHDRNRSVILVALTAFIFLLAAFALAASGLGGAELARFAALCLSAILLVLYLRDVWAMFASRRRRSLELNSVAGLAAIGFLVAGVVLLALECFLNTDLPLGPAAIYLLGMGWLSGLGLSQLYKIVPFLTWLETYGPVMGRNAVPRVQDLVDEKHAVAWFVMFYASVAVGTWAILAGSDMLLRGAASCQFVAVLALAIEYLRARLLTYVPEHLRLPPGAQRPHLIVATTKE